MDSKIGCVQHDCPKCKQQTTYFPLLIWETGFPDTYIATRPDIIPNGHAFVVVQCNANERDKEIADTMLKAARRFYGR